MTKDVLITISGLQFMEGENAEPVEMMTAGEYYWKNGKHYILYDEVLEGFSGVTKNRIKISDGCMELHRKGASNVHMIFQKNKKNLTSYQTLYGNLLMGIEASRLQVEQQKDAIDIKVEYDLEINYEHLAECALTMQVRSRGAQRDGMEA